VFDHSVHLGVGRVVEQHLVRLFSRVLTSHLLSSSAILLLLVFDLLQELLLKRRSFGRCLAVARSTRESRFNILVDLGLLVFEELLQV